MGAKVVKALPRYVVRHGANGFKYRRTVPADLVPLIGARYWVRVLKGKTLRAVEREVRPIAVEHDALIARARALPPDTVSYAVSIGGLEMAEAIYPIREAAQIAFEHRSKVDLGVLDLANPKALDQLRAAQRAQADLTAAKATLKRDASLLKTSPRGKSAAHGKTLGDLVGLWLDIEGKKDPATVSKRRTYLNRFMDATGLSPADGVASVTRDHAKRWRNDLETSATGRKNLLNQLGGVAMLFRVAEDREWIKVNPFLGVTLGASAGDDVDEDEDEPDKRPFTDDEARHVLVTLDKLTLPPNGRTDPARLDEFKLITRVVAFMGMRPGEIVQLRVQDVTTIDGKLCFAIRRSAGSIKNRWSRRDMPVHAALVDEVKAWVKRHSNGTRLFPSHYELGNPKGAFHRRSHDFIRRDCGFTDKRVSLYSFRHRWRVRARDVARMDGIMSRFLMGHKMGKDIHDTVYGGNPPPMAKRKLWMDRVKPI